MNTIHLFRPGYIDVTLEIPGTWNECDREELEFIAHNLLQPYDTRSLFYAVILLFLIQNRSRHQDIDLPRDINKFMNWEDVFQQHDQALSWIHEESTLTAAPYCRLKVGRLVPRFVYGPKSDFNDLIVAEFEDCEVFSILFHKEKNIEHLAMIASILFRPHPYGSREDYLQYSPEKMKPLFMKLPRYQLFLVYTWYCGCRTMLPKYFPNVFEKSADKSAPDVSAFTKCIHAGAGPRNGTRDQIRKSLLKEFLLDLDLQAKAQKEMERELKSHRP